MGYFIAIVLGLLVVFGLAILVAGGRKTGVGTKPGPKEPIMVADPAADEPSPGRSRIADPDVATRAQQRVPPA